MKLKSELNRERLLDSTTKLLTASGYRGSFGDLSFTAYLYTTPVLMTPEDERFLFTASPSLL